MICDRPKAQRVQAKLGARAHREDVANDSTDAGGRALERLDRARMVMALHLKRDRPAVADVDHAGILFARFDKNVWPGRRKFFKFFFRILAPHDGENAEFGKVRFATEDFFNALEFLQCKAVLRYNLRCDNRINSRRSAAHYYATLTNLRTGSITQIRIWIK